VAVTRACPAAAAAAAAAAAGTAVAAAAAGAAAAAASSPAGHAVVDDAAWLAARKQLLVKEKALAHNYEAVCKERRALPWRAVKADYIFTRASDDAPVALRDLFVGGKKEAIVMHMMFDPSSEKPCAFCSFWADGFQGQLVHLQQRVAFAVVAKAPVEKLRAVATTKGWTFPFLSSHDNTFNRDFGVEFTKEEVASKQKVYNYGSTAPYSTQNTGASVFRLGDDGVVYHTYSTFSRGIELLNSWLTLADLTPSGRHRDGLAFEAIVKHKENYVAAGCGSCSCASK